LGVAAGAFLGDITDTEVDLDFKSSDDVELGERGKEIMGSKPIVCLFFIPQAVTIKKTDSLGVI
jgi:hypothetical protein